MNDPRHPQVPHPQQPGHAHPQRPIPVTPVPPRPAGAQPQRVAPAAPQRPQPPQAPRLAPAPASDDGLDPIALVEEDELEAIEEVHSTPKKIVAFGEEGHHKKHEWKRQAQLTGTGAVRVKSFHGKYSDQGLNYLDDAVNEWLDNHPEVEVKFVTSTVAVFEGKVREPALVLNLWY